MSALSHFLLNPFDNRQVEIRPSLESLQSFSYQDIGKKNLKHSHSLMEEDESLDRNDIVRVLQEELKQIIQFHLVRDYFGTREPRMGFGDWSHESSHLHVLGPFRVHAAITIGYAHQTGMRKITDMFKRVRKLTLVDTRDDKSVFIPQWIHRFKLDVKKVRREEVKYQQPIQVKAPIPTDYPSECIFDSMESILTMYPNL
ncbi:hypothetical protein TNCV_5024761 [Trichonephila clavipes]|nr:hypothetical protein TNCV_5024761 [Trichonephila clavipes]